MEDDIINLIKKMFVKKNCNLFAPNTIAAIVSAAVGISHFSSVITPSEAKDTLLEMFDASDDIQVHELLNMEYEDVNKFIGYQVNFRDLKSALAEFEQSKDLYEKIFTTIKEISLAKKESI